MTNPDFSDPVTISLTIQEVAVMMLSYGMGLEHLMGKQAFMQMREAERPYDGIQMSAVYDSEFQRSLAVYKRFEALAEEWRKNHPMNSNDDDEEPFSELIDKALEEVGAVEYIATEHETQAGDKMQYIGEKCALIPGSIYTVEYVSKQDTGTFFAIARDGNGHYRAEDFLYAPEFRPSFHVRFVGADGHIDQHVGEQRLFEIQAVQNWGGTPYLVITTSDAQALSYPQAEFELLEDGVQ